MSKYANSYAKFLDEADTRSVLSPDASLIVIEDDMFNNRLYNYNKGLQINGELYFMKSSFRVSLECYTEHISSTFIRECGYSAQQTMMGIYQDYPAVICKDFTGEYGLFEKIGFSSDYCIYEYSLEDLISYFEREKKCDVDDCVTRLWEMCLFDFLLENEDRHCGNVGFCTKDDKCTFSPLFDNARTLDFDFFKYRKYDRNENTVDRPERIITEGGLAHSWLEYKHKKERPSEIFSKFQELDVVSAMDRSTVGFKEEWRSYFRTIIYYRHKCLIKKDKFVWEGMK